MHTTEKTLHVGRHGIGGCNRSGRDHSTGRCIPAVGRYCEYTGKAVGRARIGRIDQKWAGGAITCDNLFVEREHANRHEGSEVALRALILWMGQADRRQAVATGPTTRPDRAAPKTALPGARLHRGRTSCVRVAGRVARAPKDAIAMFTAP